VVDAYMGHVQDHAEAAVRALLDRLADGRFTYAMDNGAQVPSAWRSIARPAMPRSTSPAPARNWATISTRRCRSRAAVLYVVRTLIDDAVPMNEDACAR
jgi:5-oxoprolinase (ATP-hydrolysing)